HTRSDRDWSSDVCSSDLSVSRIVSEVTWVNVVARAHPGASAMRTKAVSSQILIGCVFRVIDLPLPRKETTGSLSSRPRRKAFSGCQHFVGRHTQGVAADLVPWAIEDVALEKREHDLMRNDRHKPVGSRMPPRDVVHRLNGTLVHLGERLRARERARRG